MQEEILNNKTFFITGGKTGGHIYPAISVCRELMERGAKLYYVGNKKNLEYGIAKSEGLEFLSLDVDAMPRKFSLKFVLWGLKTFLASIIAIGYILKYRPDVIFATGGFVCAPTLAAALALRVPYVLHDSDARPGLVTKSFAKYAKSVSIAFRAASSYIENKNTFFRGNPIKKDFYTLSKDEARKALNLDDKMTILIMGGSQGAKTVNDAAIGVIERFKDDKNIQMILQTGGKNFDDVINALGEIPQNALVKPYFDNMALPLLASDIAVSRAGSLSISELCASGLPSVLVPYPYSAQDHQKHNALKIEELGAAIVLEDKDCTSANLLKALGDILENQDKLNSMRIAALREAKPDAAREITDQLIDAMRG